METGWAVLRSRPRREPLAAEAVTAKGIETYVPYVPFERKPRATGPLFPGYLFAHVAPDSDDLLRIRSAPGVSYVLPRAGTPVLLPDGVVSAIRDREEALRASPPQAALRHGDRVKLVSGPLRLVEAIFDRRLNASGRVRILVELVRGSMAIQTEARNLEVVRRPATGRDRRGAGATSI